MGFDLDGLREELFLGAEVVHHQAGVDPGRGGDGANGVFRVRDGQVVSYRDYINPLPLMKVLESHDA